MQTNNEKIYRGGYSTKKIFLLLSSYGLLVAINWHISLWVAIVTGISYIAMLAHSKNRKEKQNEKLIVTIGVLVTLLPLAYFKLNRYLSSFQFHLNFPEFVYPLGISFFTFQAIDTILWHRKSKTKVPGLVDYALYMVFLPKIIAGPIARFKEFYRGFKTSSPYQKAIWLIYLGLFQKIAVADKISQYVFQSGQPQIINNIYEFVLTFYLYPIQLYADFLGYTNIAIGTSLLVGITLPDNFAYPYLAKSPQDFWRRWHITMSLWFKRNVYIPLGGSRKGMLLMVRNILITFALTGIWHGTGIGFLLWGLYHGLLLSFQRLLRPLIRVRLPEMWKIIITFHLIAFGWLFFRMPYPVLVTSLQQVIANPGFTSPPRIPLGVTGLVALSIFIGIDIAGYLHRFFASPIRLHWLLRMAMYIIMFYSIVLFGGVKSDFIYSVF